jgi:hypothetical protein
MSLTQFDLGSAARIARVVRHVEQDVRTKPLTFDAVQQQQRRVLLKLCKTTDDWDIDTIATLEVWHDGDPPDETASSGTDTVEAVNKIAPIGAGTFVLVGKAGNGSWYLVEAGRDCEDGLLAKRLTENTLDDTVSDSPLDTGDGPQVLIHNAGCLKWASLKKIEVIVGVELTSEGLEFTRDELWTFSDVESALEPIIIEVTECPTPE